MNERINFLVDKTAEMIPGVCSLVYESGNKGVEFTEDALEKFAELIVRECARSLWTEECHTSDLAVEEFNRNSKKIKQHFGVGE